MSPSITMSRILANLLDANIYAYDLSLFRPGNWLNDSCINYCFRRLELQILNNSILLMDPSVVSFLLIQCTTAEEYSELSLGIKIMERTWIFVPVNNSDAFDTPSSHWSLLLLHVSSGKFLHFDSCGTSNYRAAQTTATKMSSLIGR